MSEPYPPTSMLPPLRPEPPPLRAEQPPRRAEAPLRSDAHLRSELPPVRNERVRREREPGHVPWYRVGEVRMPGFVTSEFVAYVLTVFGVLVASAAVGHTQTHDDYFRADQAWWYITLLTIGYVISRGLSRSRRD